MRRRKEKNLFGGILKGRTKKNSCIYRLIEMPAYPPLRRRRDAPQDAVLDVLSHLVVQNGVTDAAVVETRLTAAYGSTFDADVVFFDPPPGRGSSWKYQSSPLGPTLHWDAARELGWMGSTRSCEFVRRTSAIIASSRGCLTRREITLFSPPSLCQPVELWAPQW